MRALSGFALHAGSSKRAALYGLLIFRSGHEQHGVLFVAVRQALAPPFIRLRTGPPSQPCSLTLGTELPQPLKLLFGPSWP
jgi:hypothetical protein